MKLFNTQTHRDKYEGVFCMMLWKSSFKQTLCWWNKSSTNTWSLSVSDNFINKYLCCRTLLTAFANLLWHYKMIFPWFFFFFWYILRNRAFLLSLLLLFPFNSNLVNLGTTSPAAPHKLITCRIIFKAMLTSLVISLQEAAHSDTSEPRSAMLTHRQQQADRGVVII